MIYLVSNRTEIPEFRSVDFIRRCTPEQSLEYLEKLDWVGFDSETGGFDYFLDPLYTIQLGDRKFQFVVDTLTVDIELYKALLLEKGLIGHNLKFDLKFLYSRGIFPTKVYDTFLGEKTLSLGIDSHRCSLADCVKRHVGVHLSKEERANINGKLTTEFILYAAKDVEYLHEIREIQLKKLAEVGSLVSMDLDNEFVKVLAYTEFCGMHLNKDMWLAKMARTQADLEYAEQTLKEYILYFNMTDFIDKQYSLFSTDTSVSINWNSPQQVVQFFKKLGVDTTVIEKGEKKDTIDAGHLSKFKSKLFIINVYLYYKECQKDLGTYGENWLRQIHPKTGRIHTEFKQLMNTGRLSSGGKRKSGESYLNFQNIPSDEETRDCFTAPSGSLLIGCDYGSQENVVLANQSLDPDLLYFYDQGFSDMHSYIASKMFPELKGLSLKEIKNNHKHRRQQSKVIGFCLAYGGSASALSSQLEISMEEADQMIKNYFEAFPQLDKYYQESKQSGLKNGYVLLSKVTGKRSYVNFYEEYLETTKEIEEDPNFWNNYKKHKENNTPTFQVLKDKVSKWFRKKGEIERMSLNYKVQGESAEMTKLACVLFWRNYVVKNNLINVVKIVNLVHDEIIAECPEELAEETAKELQKAMEDSGKKFCKRVPLKADPCIDLKWKK